MVSKWAKCLNDWCRAGTAVAAVAAISLFGAGVAAAQQAAVDVQLGSGDRVFSQETRIEAKAGDTVVIEVFATGFDGVQGLNAVLTLDDPTQISGTPVLSGGSFYPVPLISFTPGEPTIGASFAILGPAPSESGSDLKFIGSVTMTLDGNFTSLGVTLTEMKFGTSSTINPGTEILIANPRALPKTFSVDLNRDGGDQGVLQGKANPGGPRPMQLFAGGLSEVTDVTIRTEVDLTQIAADVTGFKPNFPFRVVPAAAGTLGDTSPSQFSNLQVDIQQAADNTHTPEALAITAGGGSTVAVEFFGEGYEGANGFSTQIRVSDPSAIASLTGTISPHFGIKLAEPSLSGDIIEFNLGNLGAPTSAPFQKVGTLNIELSPDFGGLVLEVMSTEFAPSGVSGSPNAVMTITPVGGLRPRYVAVDGNEIVMSLKADAPVSGYVYLGQFVARTTSSFTQTQLNFKQVTFVSGEDPPAGIEPNVIVSLRSSLSNAPAITEPPAIAAVTDERALIRWATNREGTGKVIYGTDPGQLTNEAVSTESGRIHRVSLENLQAGTRYFAQVITTDAQGNASDAFPARPLIIVTRRVADTFPPKVVRGPAAVGLTTDGATVFLETDEASTVEVIYGTSETALDQSATSDTPSKVHELRLTGLTGGETYFFKARLTDVIGNTVETPQARRFRLRASADNQPPRIVGRPSIAGATFSAAVIRWITNEPSNSAVFHGTVSGSLTDSVVVEESVGQHQVALSNLLSDTTHFYTVRSIDASGNVATSPEFHFRTRSGEDTTDPRITRPPVVARRSDTEALIVFRTNEPATASVQVGTDIAVASDTTGVEGETFSTTSPSKQHEVRITNLDPATVYFYRVAVTDITGNGPTYNRGQLSFATLSVADTTPPVVFVKPVAIGITEQGASINWAADEPHSAVVSYRVSGADDTEEEAVEDLDLSRRHAVPIAGLQPGTTYDYSVETIDGEGNSSMSTGLTFTTRSGADEAAPTIVRGPRVTNISASSATILWATDEPADTRVSWGTTSDYDETIEISEGVRFHSVTLTDLDSATEYHYAVGSADASGNVVTTDASGTIAGLSQDHTFRTRAVDDADPPVITEGPLAEIRNNLAILKWRTDELSTSRVAVGVLAGSDAASVEGTPVFGEATEIVFEENLLTRNHVVTVTGLSPGLDYLFQVSSTDAAGNTVQGADPTAGGKVQPPGGFGSFTTTTEADTQFPVITSGPTVVASTSSSLTIEWATDESSNGTVDFGTDESDLSLQEVSGTNETTHRMVLTKLATGTTYAYQVGSTDASGNGATKSAVVFASTAASEDLTAPVINTTPSVIYVNDRQATISWQTNEAADAEVAYGTSEDELVNTSNESDFNTSHSVTLTNLDAGTTYYYRVNSSDQNNNGPAQSSVLSFATEALPDTAPPTVSTIAAATTSTEAVITWSTDELSDSAVRYGTQSGSLDFNTGDSEDVTGHSVTLTNLTPATTYTYTVQSIDRAGNQGAQSEELTFTTLAEGESPTLSAPTEVAASPGNGIVEVTWTASTSGGVTGAIVERSVDGGDFASVATLENVTTYLDNNVANGTSYSYQIRAVGLASVQSDASSASESVTPAEGIGPSTPVLSVKQGNPLQPTFVIENSSPLNDGDALNYTFHLSSQSDFSDALTLDSGLGEGAGLGSSDPAGFTAWTVDRELTDGETYHYRVKASDGTFSSGFLTGQFTVNSAELPYTGDIDGDFVVGFVDFLSLVTTFNKQSADAEYNASADFNADGSVDFTDFLTFVGAFGKQFIRGEDASSKPVVALTYGVDAQTRFDLVGRSISSEAGGKLIVEVHAKDVEDMAGAGFRLDYDTDALQFVEAFQGNDALLRSDNRRAEMFATLEHDPAKGEMFVAGAITEGGAVSGEGVVARLEFVLKTDHPQGDLLNLAEGLVINGDLNVNAAQNLGARLTLVPQDFALEHNFPNPFNPETTIRYSLPEAAQVRLVIYNVLGQEVTRLVDRDQVPGFYAMRWNGTDSFGRGVASGVYLYKIQAVGATQKYSQVHKMLLLK